MHIETERKFLINMPDTEVLLGMRDCRVKQIVQTYLTIDNETGEETRVRSIEENGETTYVFTEKKKISAVSRFENEYSITADGYRRLIDEAEEPRELTKTRYAFPWGERTVEIDVYPPEIGGDGLCGKAVLEIEMEDEREKLEIPDFIEVVRELTGTKEFSNKTLALPIKKAKKV